MKDSFNFMFGPQGLILIGGILTLIGAFWSAKSDLKSEKALNEKNRIIIEKTETIADLNIEIVNALTGGDSYPYVIMSSLDGKIGFPMIQISGKNPIANVSGSLVDIRALRKKQKNGIFEMSSGVKFNKNIVSPVFSSFVIDKQVTYDISKSGRYIIHFNTPYSSYTQVLALERSTKNGNPSQAYKIYKGIDINQDSLIFTEYPEHFPIPINEIDFLEIIEE